MSQGSLRCGAPGSEGNGWKEKIPEGEEKETSAAEDTTGNPFTEADRQHPRERRERHHTKRWYEKQLLAIANGDVVPTKEQHKALITFGRTGGWNRRSPAK